MQSRTYRDLAPFNASIANLRAYFRALRRPAQRRR